MGMVRNSANGRFLGKDNQFYNFEDEAWKDYKESHLRFPQHNQGSSEVHSWKMTPEELAAKFGK